MDYSKLRSICILGAGKEGLSAAQFLLHTYPHIKLTIADRVEKKEAETLPVALCMGQAYPTDLSLWDAVVVSPGVLPTDPLLASARQITTATNLFFQHCAGTIIGVTGSKGKSTTSALITHILHTAGFSARTVGNIGTPALTALLEHNAPEDIFVYELSSYQASRLQQGPDVALVLNLFPEHMNYHGSIERYYSDKLKITYLQNANQLVIYNNENAELVNRMRGAQARKKKYPNETWWYTTDHIMHGNTVLCDLSGIPLHGSHNASNIVAALTTLEHYHISDDVLRSALKSFSPLKHRLERVGIYNSIEWIDDAISTTPESTLAALETHPNTGAIILGGLDRGYQFDALVAYIAHKRIPIIVYFPESGATIAQALHAAGYTPEHELHTSSMQDAVAYIARYAPQGSTALLSCASPSYSLFKNFEDKGDQFQAAIRTIAL